MADSHDRWLPATDAKTARQKMQRAFAIEFLCPIQSLTAFLDGDFSSDATEEAAEHFGVSHTAVETHLVNNCLLSPEVLRDHDSHFEFPYIIHPKSL
jgi:Zn-dependent peptidase ImmA (M78 family)